MQHAASVLYLVGIILFWVSFLFRGLAQPQMAFLSNSALTLINAISLFGDWLIEAILFEISLLCFFSPNDYFEFEMKQDILFYNFFKAFSFPVLEANQIKTPLLYFRVFPDPIYLCLFNQIILFHITVLLIIVLITSSSHSFFSQAC